MILTRSPYYITVPWLSPSSGTVPDKYIVQIFVWTGLNTSVPSTPQYEEENVNPLGLSGSLDVNISPYINDFLEISLVKGSTTGMLDSLSTVRVKAQVIYYINDVAQSPELVTEDLAVKGYGYGIEGKNPTRPANKVLAFGTYVNVSKDTQFTIPILIDTSTAVSVTSYPNNTINYNETKISYNSDSLIQNIYVQCVDEDYIEIKKDNALICTLNVKEELRYTPFDVWFVNKYGKLQSITFFKEVVNSLKVESESYEGSNGQAKDGVHQIVNYNKKGNSEFKAKTGFISEVNNEIIKQLLLSEKVWILQGDIFNPINVSSSSLEYQTRQKDRLLNYELSFEYAYNEINDI